jgi:hypothetical protein
MRTGFHLCGLVIALMLGAISPGSAEFFGCNDKPGQVLSYDGQRRQAGHTSHEFAAQSSRPRITIYPRSSGQPRASAKRQCRSWLAKEYRVSGTVVVPRQQCWWE